MNPVNRILDFFCWNKGDRDEERQWQASGSYPDEVDRAYRKQRDFERDAARLQTMGYRPAHVGQGKATTEAWASSGAGGKIATPDVTEFIQVRYERQSTLLAPGTEMIDNPSEPKDR